MGFRLRRHPDTVRAPDAAFIAQDRLPAGRRHRGYFEGAPDLTVEVVSPEDRPAEVRAKVREWLEAGARLVWVLWPETRTVSVYPAHGDARDLGEADSLDGGDVLPGFSCRVGDLFD